MRIQKSSPEKERIIFIGDTHHPFHDPKAVALALSFVRWWEPHRIYLIGDICDMYALSKYLKDPELELKLQEELDSVIEFLVLLRTAAPHAKIIYKDGNHEERLYNYNRKNSALLRLRDMQLPYLLRFHDLNIEYYRYKETLMLGEKFMVEHGNIVRRGSANTANAMVTTHHMSGISGHTHRMGVHFRTTTAGEYQWVENGCLCDRSPEYGHGVPDWQLGFTVAFYDKQRDKIHLQQVPIQNYTIFFDQILFEVVEDLED